MMKRKPQRKAKKNNWWLIAGACVVLAGIAWYSLRSPQTAPIDQAQLKPPQVPTLDPALFTGKAREAYQAAKEVPAVLQEMPCYCGCMNNGFHKNNLWCFHDNHAEDCDVCQDIALDAREMYKAGTPIDRIRAEIQAKYKRNAR
jgi:hypothetical protein